MEASTTPKSCMDFLLVLLKKSDDISEHGPWFTAQKVCKGQLECPIQCAIYIYVIALLILIQSQECYHIPALAW